MSIGSRIKERREAISITQEELANLLGVSKGAIGNYEAGISYPKIENMTKLFEILQTDANYLFQDSIFKIKDEKFSEKEKLHIKKYRTLDEHGKKAIDNLLDVEYNRCAVTENKEKTVKMFKVARSSDGEKPQTVELTQEEYERLLKAVEMDDNEF